MREENQASEPADETLRRLNRWAEAQPSVRAMLLTSTRAIPHATVDALSDYDVILVVEDIHAFVAERQWPEAFGEVLVSYWDPVHPNPATGVEQAGNVIQYAGGLKIDFTLWPVALLRQIAQAPALPAELDAGYVVLLDKDQLAAGMPAPTYTAYIPRPPDQETFQRVVEEFFSDAPYVAKCLWRGELLPAKWRLDYDMKHLYLRPMLEWRAECDHRWSAPVGALGKGLKKLLPPALWSQLEQTYVGAGMAENWAALFSTMTLFRQAAMEVAAHLGYIYPEELDRRVTAYVEQVKRLEPLAGSD
ncbi:MAG TPA: aminoglycoside 6-adenylyltransferase [Caldilineaceae bacterium]|nr:aminoglycoside 6-adenylyltransferase [Caldilineaceae bacterium]